MGWGLGVQASAHNSRNLDGNNKGRVAGEGAAEERKSGSHRGVSVSFSSSPRVMGS